MPLVQSPLGFVPFFPTILTNKDFITRIFTISESNINHCWVQNSGYSLTSFMKLQYAITTKNRIQKKICSYPFVTLTGLQIRIRSDPSVHIFRGPEKNRSGPTYIIGIWLKERQNLWKIYFVQSVVPTCNPSHENKTAQYREAVL